MRVNGAHPCGMRRLLVGGLAAILVAIATAALAPAAGALTKDFCSNQFTASGHRCPYDMASASFWSDRHSWSYVEAWGGHDGYSNTNCEEAWREHTHALLSRQCWGGVGYADSTADQLDGRYLAIADAWDYHVSFIGGVYLWGQAHTP
jgi:hypothetical protein